MFGSVTEFTILLLRLFADLRHGRLERQVDPDLLQTEIDGHHLKIALGILTCTPYTGLSTSWVIATWPAMLTS
jgi:hypothetical protein